MRALIRRPRCRCWGVRAALVWVGDEAVVVDEYEDEGPSTEMTGRARLVLVQ